MNTALDAAQEKRTAHDAPLFASLPGDIAISFEFFPPKTEKMNEQLWSAIETLAPMDPRFVSVTYGAGGSTRERTHATVARIARETNLPAAAHQREELRERHAHARLGFEDRQMEALITQSGYAPQAPITLDEGELVVKIWIGTRLPAASRVA